MQTQYLDEVLDEFADWSEADSYDDEFYSDEGDAFDPRPPRRGTTLLTRFAPDGSTLSSTHINQLRVIADAIVARMPTTDPFFHCIVVDVEGHEDETGDPAQFREVGLRRALAAANKLKEQLEFRVARIPAANRRGVDIQVTSAGPNRPIRSNVTDAGRALNRRAEVRFRVENCPGVT